MSVDAPPESPIPWAALESATGCTRETYYTRLAEGLIVAGARFVVGHAASDKRARRARHRAYSLEVVRPAPKLTRAEEIKRDSIALGTWKVAA